MKAIGYEYLSSKGDKGPARLGHRRARVCTRAHAQAMRAHARTPHLSLSLDVATITFFLAL